MRKIIIRTIAALSLLASLSLATVYAQSNSRSAFKIPFEFTAGDQTFPAGEYRVEALPNGASAWVRISSDGGRKSSTFTSLTQAFGKTDPVGKLVFNRYGDQYFLRSYNAAGDHKECDLVPSRAEKALIKKARAGKDYLASAPTIIEIGALERGN